MKKILVLMVSLVAPLACLWGQETVYLIDNVVVSNFDGSQLKGKTIRDYRITTSGSVSRPVTVHTITTEGPMIASFTFKADTVSMKPQQVKVVYIIDGVKHEDSTAFQSISPSDIRNITVFQKGTPEYQQFGKNRPVIIVETKKVDADLEEFLRSVPGAKIDANGKITVNGKPVRRIMVEGQSVFVDE